MTEKEVLLKFVRVGKFFPVPTGFIAGLRDKGEGPAVRAVDDVSFEIKRGEVLGLAGESGSGKSTVGRLAVRLLDPTAGEVWFDGIDLATLNSEEMRKMRSRMQVVFQDPLASLNPRMTIGQAVEHPLQIHRPKLTSKQRREEVYEIFHAVGLDPPRYFYDRYPHQISGGQRQRVVMARGLVTRPDLIILDEPIAMADVSVQALLLDLMMRLKDEFDLTYLFITHDLATTKYLCDRLAIMYLGKIVEVGPLNEIFANPQQPYTRALLSAVPVPDPRHRRTEPLPIGEIPSPIDPPPGCHFNPRCSIAQPGICDSIPPELLPWSDELTHLVSCHLRTGSYQDLDPEKIGIHLSDE
jgi:peptide/nickel transport system ATP-binding protein